MTEKERVIFWQRNENRKKRLLLTFIGPIRSALNYEHEKAYKAYKAGIVINEQWLMENITGDRLKLALVALWLRTGFMYAKNSYFEIRKLKFQSAGRNDVWVNELLKYLSTENYGLVKDITEETRNQIAKGIRKAIDEGLGIPEAAKLIMGDQVNRVRAKRIARTEILSASNHGSYIGALSNEFQTTKHWVSVFDSRTRRKPRDKFDHLDMDKQIADLKSPFIVSGQPALYPGDVRLSAGNRINCRCTLYFKAKRDANGLIIPNDPIILQPIQQPSTIYLINIFSNIITASTLSLVISENQDFINTLRKIFNNSGLEEVFNSLFG